MLNRKVSDLPDEMISHLRALTMQDEGYMRQELNAAVEAADGRSYCLILCDGDQPISWALVLRPDRSVSTSARIMLFTADDYRNRGHGTRILREIEFLEEEVTAGSWDEIGQRLFRRFSFIDDRRLSFIDDLLYDGVFV